MNFNDRRIFTDDRLDDYILPADDQCVVKVVKRLVKDNNFLVLAPSGKIFEVSLSLKYKDFLHSIKPGHYVLVESIPGSNKAEIVTALDNDSIRQYVYDKVWPPEFNPNVTKFHVRKKQRQAVKQKIRRFKGLHSDKKYLAAYNRQCQPSSTSSSDNVPEGECETWPPRMLHIIEKHKRNFKPWFPPGPKPKNLNPNKTRISYLKKVAAKEIEKDDEYGLMMRRLAEWKEKGGKKPTKGSWLCARLKRKLEKEVKQTKKRKHIKQDKSSSESTETDSDSTYSSQTTSTENSTIEDDKANKTTDSKIESNKEIETSEANPTTSNIENDEAIKTDSNTSETKTADSKKENEKSSTTAPISSGIAATTSKVEDDIAIITDICARGVGATGSKCTPWGILRSSKYKNKKITQEMIDAFIRDEVTKEQEKLIKKEKLRRAVVKTLGEDFEVSSSESADTGQGSGSSGEGEDTDEEKDKKTKDKKKKEKEKKEKEKKEKEKKEKEKKKRQKMPKGCRIAGIKNREEIMRDT